jgi:hypothetical protein
MMRMTCVVMAQNDVDELCRRLGGRQDSIRIALVETKLMRRTIILLR